MTDDKDAFEFLERLEVDATDAISRSHFKGVLEKRFDSLGMKQPTGKQVNRLFEIADDALIAAPNLGVRRVQFLRLGKPQTRFVIEGQRGLFGLTKALKFLRGR